MGWISFWTPSAILGHPCGHFGFSRLCGVAGVAVLQAVSEGPGAARLVFYVVSSTLVFQHHCQIANTPPSLPPTVLGVFLNLNNV